MKEAKIHLRRSDFFNDERLVVEQGQLSASTFLFESGVAGLRLKSDVANVVMLPFQGQQIWSASILGRDLGMKSVCSTPIAGVPFLQTFGGFMQHCGVLAMGAPGPQDNHPLHGELPNAPFQRAWIRLGEDSSGQYIGLGGEYRNSAVFGSNYSAEPFLKIYAASTILNLSFCVTNLKNTPMELMYMAHINFRSVIDGQLFYSAKCSPEHVRVRATIPTHIQPKPGYAELLQELTKNPAKHHALSANFPADPEIVLCIDYLADSQGWAHSMQVHPDGNADYVAHKPTQLPRATRWISRTPDHDSLALVEPGTSEPEGYTAEKKKGNILALGAGQQFCCDIRIGTLQKAQAAETKQVINKIIENS